MSSRTPVQDRARVRDAFALEVVTKLGAQRDRLLPSLPVLVRTQGLVTAIAWLSEGEGGAPLTQGLDTWLRKQLGLLPADGSLVQACLDAELHDYLAAQAEALRMVEAYKRMSRVVG